MTDLDALLAGIVADPLEETQWLVLADWLEENDDPRRAELLRLHRRMLATCCEPDAHPERAAWQSRMTELLIAGVKPCVPQETLTLPGGVPMTFSFIPPGSFLMGSDNGEEEEKPRHRVELQQGFFLGVYPVTQAQWFAVMGTDPSQFKGAERPVEQVPWDDCREFCAMLSGQTGRRVELPTEPEWEYACRAGTTTGYYFGDEINPDLANHSTEADWNTGENNRGTTAVGSFPANPWGLYDLHGNVSEWCADSFRNSHIVRGGSWDCFPEFCRAAYRWWHPTHREEYCGFRVCLRLS